MNGSLSPKSHEVRSVTGSGNAKLTLSSVSSKPTYIAVLATELSSYADNCLFWFIFDISNSFGVTVFIKTGTTLTTQISNSSSGSWISYSGTTLNISFYTGIQSQGTGNIKMISGKSYNVILTY